MSRNFYLVLFSLFSYSLSGQIYQDPDSLMLEGEFQRDISQTITLQINEFMAINSETLVNGNTDYSDWIELYNYGDDPVDLNGIFITDDLTEPWKHQFQFDDEEGIIPAGEFRIIWADALPDLGPEHLTFALSGTGEDIGIFTSDLFPVDGISYSTQLSDVSYGRLSEGAVWNYFEESTPDNPNSTEGSLNITSTPILSHSGGIYESEFTLTISSIDEDASIYYTLDNTVADNINGILYTDPINISEGEAKTIRARAYAEGSVPGYSCFATYIFNETFTLPIMNLVGDPDDIWGVDGIYDNPYSGQERPIEIEYLNPGGEFQFSISAGMKIHGPDSRPQKSLRLYMRSRYDDDVINYPLFPQKFLSGFQRLVLRNGGNDGQQISRSNFRDILVHKLYRKMDPLYAYSAFQPVNVHLNGEYWGIYNLRERQDEFYIEDNYGFDDVDFLERTASVPGTYETISGDWDDYNALKEFVVEEDLSIDENYEIVSSWMDIENFVDYMIIEIWTGNRDWLSNNVKYWRPRNNPDEKWKWILWDTEYGLGCYPANDHGQPGFDALQMSMTWGGWGAFMGNSNYMISNLVENEEFTEYFITRSADLYNTVLRPEEVATEIDYFEDLLLADMPKQADKWGGTMSGYNDHIDIIRWYTELRPSNCRQHIINQFEMAEEEQLLTINIEPAEGGYIKLNTISVHDDEWDGYYFQGVPVKMEAVANPGFEFQNWSSGSTDASWTIMMEEDMSITAYFEGESIEQGNLLINEINYNSLPTQNSNDWVEIYNEGPASVDMTDYVLKDEEDFHIFEFPEDFILDAEAYIVVCRDTNMFKNINPDVNNFLGNPNFGFDSSQDQIRLFDPSGELIDIVAYTSLTPWPLSPNGNGQTLELISPELNNENPANWFARNVILGSPGVANDYNVSVGEYQEGEIAAKASPNPFSESSFITVNHPDPGEAVVYDVHGKEVANLTLRTRTAEGLHLFQWNAGSEMAPGLYICRFRNVPSMSVKIIYNPW